MAVQDVDSGAKWYERILGLRNTSPGGHGFAVLKSETNEIVLCLHQWEMDNHPTMTNPGITSGNGFMLYFRTENMDAIYKRFRGRLENRRRYSVESRTNEERILSS